MSGDQIEGLLMIAFGLITLHPKVAESIIRVTNEYRGVKPDINPTALKFQKIFAILIIIGGVYLIIF